MTFAKVVARTQMSEVLAPSRASIVGVQHLSAPTDLGYFGPQSIAALWSDEPIRGGWGLPDVLVTADGAERDWFAWLATFAPNIRPLTAYCRVLTLTAFAERWSAIRAPDLGRLGCAAVGAILGEVFSSSEDGALRLREPPSVVSCTSVLSFSLARALALYSRPVLDMDMGQLARRWSFTRDLTRQRPRIVTPNLVLPVMQVLGQLSSGIVSPDEATANACLELLDRGEVVSADASLGPVFARAAKAMASATREERLAILEDALKALEPSLTDSDGFKVGYLVSRMAPGSFAHARLVAGFLKRCPSALLWYGLCAGLSEGTTLLNEFGGVGRRVLRELLAPEDLVARPRTDISLGELEVLLEGRGHRIDDVSFPTSSPNSLSVALEVGVPTTVNWGRSETQRQLERPDDWARMVAELGFLSQRLGDLQKRVRSQYEAPPEPSHQASPRDQPAREEQRPEEQPSLFGARKSERRSTRKR